MRYTDEDIDAMASYVVGELDELLERIKPPPIPRPSRRGRKKRRTTHDTLYDCAYCLEPITITQKIRKIGGLWVHIDCGMRVVR